MGGEIAKHLAAKLQSAELAGPFQSENDFKFESLLKREVSGLGPAYNYEWIGHAMNRPGVECPGPLVPDARLTYLENFDSPEEMKRYVAIEVKFLHQEQAKDRRQALCRGIGQTVFSVSSAGGYWAAVLFVVEPRSASFPPLLDDAEARDLFEPLENIGVYSAYRRIG